MMTLREMECSLLSTAIRKTRGNLTEACELLGVSRRSGYNKIREHGLEGLIAKVRGPKLSADQCMEMAQLAAGRRKKISLTTLARRAKVSLTVLQRAIVRGRALLLAQQKETRVAEEHQQKVAQEVFDGGQP